MSLVNSKLTLIGHYHSQISKQLFFLRLIFFLADLDLHCWAWTFSSCDKWGLLFVGVHGLLIAAASLVAEHRL